jgi:2,4-dienoyl-CoA reductase-like NADH-dependent reductase (Old Yellow Enzyme family)/thioredoxin reductase
MNLFEPYHVGRLELKNRLVMTAMSTRLAGPRGQVTDRMIEYYSPRAAGGVGMVTVEEASIHPQLPHVPNALGIYGDHLLPGLRELTRRIHDAGALASLQIGLYFRPQVTGFQRFTASAEAPDCTPDCKELTPDEIHYLTALYVDAAVRTREAGFDAVEIHACHACILSEFLSPYWNRRTDRYGGDRSGRFRFALEILEGIRGRLGPDYPVIYRISGSEFHPGGFSPEDGIALALALERGGVAAINVSGGLGHVNHISIPPSDVPRGILLPLARGIKAAVTVPVICGNSLTPDMAEQAVSEGRTDLVGLGRPLIADPDWPIKVREGRTREIRTCIRCNQGCFGGLRDLKTAGVTCLYNPAAGRELERRLHPAATKRRVAVIGGGPAGCETARVARLRGHDVLLIEKEGRLGGQFNLAARPPEKGDFVKLVDFYAQELARLGVEVRLNTEATTDMIQALAVDVTVVATGSTPVVPNMPGVDLPHVTTTHDVLSGRAASLKNPVVVIGGGATGLETADFLSGQGLVVTVIEMLDSPGRDMMPGIGVREGLLARLAEKKVGILTGRRAMAVEPDAVIVSDRTLKGGGNEVRISAQSVVFGLGNRAEGTMARLEPVCGCGGVLCSVGDCRSLGNALNAVHAAYDLAAAI